MTRTHGEGFIPRIDPTPEPGGPETQRLRPKMTWQGRHLGLGYEVVQVENYSDEPGTGPGWLWRIYLPRLALDEDMAEKLFDRDAIIDPLSARRGCNSDALRDELNGAVSFDVVRGSCVDGFQTLIISRDFMHYANSGHDYSLAEIDIFARLAISTLTGMIPVPKVFLRCKRECGPWAPRALAVPVGNGDYYCAACAAERQARIEASKK